MQATEAARIALDALRELYPGEELVGLDLEELEASADGSSWEVTVGFTRGDPQSAIDAMTGDVGPRVFKVLCIDAGSGAVRSMKNRVL